MTSQTIVKDMNVIRKLGIEALTEKLGPLGMVEFMRQFDSGYGNYTKERHNWLEGLTIEDISNEIKKIKGTK
jgi:DNA-directed RNA polymerase